MISVDNNHLGGAPCGAAGFNRARCCVADFQKAQQTGAFAAARKRFVLPSNVGKIRAGAGAVFEQQRFAFPQIHDAAIACQAVIDGLNETGVRLRAFIGAFGFGKRAGGVVDIEVPLAGGVDPVSPVKAGVEPLRRVRGADLLREHGAHLVQVRKRRFLIVEIAAFPSPIGPGAGHPVKHLLRRCLRPVAFVGGKFCKGRNVGHGALQEVRHAFFFHPLGAGGNASLPQIFLSEDVDGGLAPAFGNLKVAHLENDLTGKGADFRIGAPEDGAAIRRARAFRISPINTHSFLSFRAPGFRQGGP